MEVGVNIFCRNTGLTIEIPVGNRFDPPGSIPRKEMDTCLGRRTGLIPCV